MSRFSYRILGPLAAFSLLLGACSDDSGGKDDTGVTPDLPPSQIDGSVDMPVTSPDQGVPDMPVTSPDQGVPDMAPQDDMPVADMAPQDDQAVADMAPVADMPVTDMSTADQALSDAAPAPQNSTCTSAKPVNLGSGPVTEQGDTTNATNEFGTQINCGLTSDYDGNQLYYLVDIPAGKGLKLDLKPSFYTYLIIFPYNSTAGCAPAAINTACASSGDGARFYSSSDKTFYYWPTTPGQYVVSVDSSSPSTSGSFELTFTEVAMATNGSCTSPETVTLTSGKATITGDTNLASDYDALVNCGYSSDFDGPQLYYKVSMSNTNYYKLTYDPTFYSYLYIFPASTSCTDTAAVNTACAGPGTGLYEYVSTSTAPEDIYFTPSTSQDYIIVLDSTGTTSSYMGSFTLDIEEMALPTNTTCTNAESFTLTSGQKTTITGSTYGSTDEFAGVVCSGSTALDGPQVYYKTSSMKADTTYKVSFSPQFNAYLYLFTNDGAASNCTENGISTDCASGGVTGGYEYTSSGSTDTFLFTTPSTLPAFFYLGVDSTTSTYLGDFTIEIEEFTKPQNDTCATAESFTVTTGQTTTLTGDTLGALDQYAGVNCGGTTAFDGGQVYYKTTSLKGDTTYKIVVDSAFTARVYMFTDQAGCMETGINTDCGGTAGFYEMVTSSSSPETIWFTTPATPATTYYLAVDSSAPTTYGAFTIDISEFTVPTFTAPFTYDFESDCKGLAATLDWECGAIGTNACTESTLAPTAGHSGTHAWGTILNDCHSDAGNNTGYSSTGACSNTNPDDDSILKFKVTIPSGWSTATLSWWEWVDVNYYFDWNEVRINGTSAKAWCPSSASNPTAWVQQSIDLSSYAGQTIEVAFHFLASSVVSYTGWYIDDLSVTGN